MFLSHIVLTRSGSPPHWGVVSGCWVYWLVVEDRLIGRAQEALFHRRECSWGCTESRCSETWVCLITCESCSQWRHPGSTPDVPNSKGNVTAHWVLPAGGIRAENLVATDRFLQIDIGTKKLHGMLFQFLSPGALRSSGLLVQDAAPSALSEALRRPCCKLEPQEWPKKQHFILGDAVLALSVLIKGICLSWKTTQTSRTIWRFE